MPTAKQIREYAANPAAFLADLRIPAATPARFADLMARHQREWIAALAPSLLALARGQKPPIGRFWLEATKGAAKDTTLAACLLWLLTFTNRSLACQVGAADADQADELRKAAKSILGLNPWLGQRTEVQSWRIVCSVTSSEAEIIAADVAGSHGARPDFLILNELTHISKFEFAENLMDNASKVPHGLAIIATNAGHTGTDAWRWRELARTSPRWFFHVFSDPAPWLDAAEIAEAQRRNSTARYNRLWRGVWGSGSGDALDPADIDAAVDPNLQPLNATGWSRRHLFGPIDIEAKINRPQNFTFVAGLDLGIRNDHSALVVLGADHSRQRIRLASAKWWAPDPATGKVDLEQVKAETMAVAKQFRAAVRYDPWQAALMAQQLAREGGLRLEEVPFVGSTLNLLATTLIETFRSRRIDLYPCPRLVADLRRLTIVEKSYGHKLEATRDADGHADVATALAIALPAAVEALPHGGTSVWGGVIDSSTVGNLYIPQAPPPFLFN
jgi:phage terminase large subunit-like protein